MGLHPLHPARHGRILEIKEDAYHTLMHDLTLAGASEPTNYGSGWVAHHPEFGKIAVSRVEYPARHRRHAPFAFFVECFSGETFDKLKVAA